MSELVVEAEQRLAAVLEAMRDVLQSSIEDALPRSQLHPEEEEQEDGDPDGGTAHSDIPDSLQQRLEWEAAVEAKRVRGLSAELQHRVDLLKGAIVQLGGGVDPEGRVIDVPVEVLDKEIEQLSVESARLGGLMVQHYDESRRIAAALEEEIMEQSIPSL